MKAILKFNLPKDISEFNDASNGTKWKIAMYDLNMWLRSETKYAPDSMSEDTYNALKSCRDKLHEILNNDNLDLD